MTFGIVIEELVGLMSFPVAPNVKLVPALTQAVPVPMAAASF